MIKTKELYGTDYLIARAHEISDKGAFDPSDVADFVDALKGLQRQIDEFESIAEEERIRADKLEDESEYHSRRVSKLEGELEDAENVRGEIIDDCIRALLKVRSAVRAAGLADAKDDIDRVIRDLDPERRFA